MISVAKSTRSNKFNAPAKVVAFKHMLERPPPVAPLAEVLPAAPPAEPPTWAEQPIPHTAQPNSQHFSVIEGVAERMRGGERGH